MNGITKMGASTEALLKELTGYSEPIVEVKVVAKDGGNSKTINQVRAIDLVPLCVYHAPKDQWYVIPPLRNYS